MENNFMPLILSSRFKEILFRIKDEISMTLLNMENNSDFVYPISMIDISDEEGSVSFLPASKYYDLPKDRGNGDLPWTCSARNNIKAGRIINKIAPFYKQADIEKWVNSFKAEYKNIMKNIHFEVISGKDIAKYYNGRVYASGNGSLNKSCMRHDGCESYMKLYVQNPDKIKMLILMENKGYISGRALLWKLDEPENTWFLDRIYVKEDSDVLLFKKYAKEHGWLYKNHQTFDAVNVIKDDVETFVNMKVNIQESEYKYFPYLDTLLFYDKKNKYLTNNIEDYKNNSNIIKLREINGRDSGNEFFVEDVFNNEIISIEDAIYCYYGDGYTHKNNAIYLNEEDEFALPSEIVYSEYTKTIEASVKCVYSHCLDTYINRKLVSVVLLDKEGVSWDYMLNTDTITKYSYVDGSFYINEILTKSGTGDMVLQKEEKKESSSIKKRGSFFDSYKKNKK